jgi:hypothetical protein
LAYLTPSPTTVRAVVSRAVDECVETATRYSETIEGETSGDFPGADRIDTLMEAVLRSGAEVRPVVAAALQEALLGPRAKPAQSGATFVVVAHLQKGIKGLGTEPRRFWQDSLEGLAAVAA